MVSDRAFPFLDFALAFPELPPFLELLSRAWDKEYTFPQPVVAKELARIFVPQPQFQYEPKLWYSPHYPFAFKCWLEATPERVSAVFQNLLPHRIVRLLLCGILWIECGIYVGVRRKVKDIANWNVLSSVDCDLDHKPRHGLTWSQEQERIRVCKWACAIVLKERVVLIAMTSWILMCAPHAKNAEK
jgi:hypothetical protein